jgi:hypothetical protein
MTQVNQFPLSKQQFRAVTLKYLQWPSPLVLTLTTLNLVVAEPWQNGPLVDALFIT